MDRLTEIIRIPFPSLILAGEWAGTVYAITTAESNDRAFHDVEVELAIAEIKAEFSNRNHYTVSLREVKREAFYSGAEYVTLVQFRVRDSY